MGKLDFTTLYNYTTPTTCQPGRSSVAGRVGSRQVASRRGFCTSITCWRHPIHCWREHCRARRMLSAERVWCPAVYEYYTRDPQFSAQCLEGIIIIVSTTFCFYGVYDVDRPRCRQVQLRVRDCRGPITSVLSRYVRIRLWFILIITISPQPPLRCHSIIPTL